MNKLEEYLQNEAQKLYEGEKGMYLSLLDMGDKILALDLPVKFAEWLALNAFSKAEFKGTYVYAIDKSLKLRTLKELYQYWVENIYKPE